MPALHVRYKHIKHGYVRVDAQHNMYLSIPWRKRFDNKFKQRLIEKGKKLIRKQATKHQLNSNSIWSKTFIRGYMQLSWSELEKDQTLIFVCLEQSKIRADYYAKQLGVQYKQLRIRKLRSKRGSCSSTKNISINRQLMYLPRKFLHYVVVHEICHLVHMHHQKSFWDCVEQFVPNHRQIRKELRQRSL